MSKNARFYLSDYEFSKDKIFLTGADSLKHARKVLRLEKGENVELFDGNGNVFTGEIELLTKELMVVVVESSRYEESTRPFITLAQALPKAGKLDKIFKMNTEIGVREFLPFESDHSVVKVSDITPKKLQRYGKIIEQTARQSHNNYLPVLSSPVSFDELLETKADIKILLSTSREAGDELHKVRDHINKESKVLVVVGPEGGFSATEIEKAKTAGFEEISLNLPVLRTETAGVVVCSFLLI